MSDYENEINAARILAKDMLAANPGKAMATAEHGGIRVHLYRNASEHVVRICTDCRHDIPGSCAAATRDDHGYLVFPEEPCYQAKEAA